jgi:hypothetical protein
MKIGVCGIACEKCPKMATGNVLTARPDAGLERINSAKFATAPSKKALNYASSARNSPVRPPNQVQSATVIAPIWQAKVRLYRFGRNPQSDSPDRAH